jgi:hypothetical protein
MSTYLRSLHWYVHWRFIRRHITVHIVESVDVALVFVMKLVVYRFNWRDIFTYVVCNVSNKPSINRIMCSKWFIHIWSLHISGYVYWMLQFLYVYSLQYANGACYCQFCHVEGTLYYWSPLCHYFLLWNPEFQKVLLQIFILKPILCRTLVLRISLITTNKSVNCWNPLILVWKCMEGIVSMSNICGTDGGVKAKCSRTGGSGGPYYWMG